MSVFAPKGRRNVATGEAQSGERRTERNPWKMYPFFYPAPEGQRKGDDFTTIAIAIAMRDTSMPPAPTPGDSYKFLSGSSRGNLQADFPSAEAGKTAYYALRWVSTRGEKGPWSEVAAATVAA